METRKLYYEDAALRQFEAAVTACRPEGKGYRIALDATAFYPEGGGQNCDTGTLNGAPVTDVQEKDGEIWHLTDRAFAPGERVRGAVDDLRRRDLTEQHSGEHIVSGLIHAAYGGDNVGFHMGADAVTVDWNCPIGEKELGKIEDEANRYIRENHAVETAWPTPAELQEIPYRSKKELTGPVRIVTFPGADVCACCGTHVTYTGEIGLVKFLSARNFKGGIRVEMVSGGRAVRYMDALLTRNREISNLLSVPPLQTAEGVRKLLEDMEALRRRMDGMREARFAALAQQYAGKGDALLFEPELDPEGVRKLCAAVMETCGGVCAVFSPAANGGFSYALGRPGADLRDFVKTLNAALDGRGGGRDAFFAQGSVRADRAAVERFFAR